MAKPRPEAKTCRFCKTKSNEVRFVKHRNTYDGLGKICVNCHNERGRREQRDLRNKVIDGYGGKCNCCEESIREFLALDHVANDGGEKRKIQRQRVEYRLALKNNFPPEYQILCSNCNWGKHVNNGVCPHKTMPEFVID